MVKATLQHKETRVSTVEQPGFSALWLLVFMQIYLFIHLKSNITWKSPATNSKLTADQTFICYPLSTVSTNWNMLQHMLMGTQTRPGSSEEIFPAVPCSPGRELTSVNQYINTLHLQMRLGMIRFSSKSKNDLDMSEWGTSVCCQSGLTTSTDKQWGKYQC